MKKNKIVDQNFVESEEYKKQCERSKIFKLTNGSIVIVSIDDGQWHLSISKQNKYPSMDEIRDARYRFIPNNVNMAMIYPPKEEYINLHENCFHLWELKNGN